MVQPVTFNFDSIPAEIAGDHDELWARVPRKSGVFRIFDVHDNLILLEKTHNLAERLEQFYAEQRRTRALDLRRITGKIEFCQTDSPFETLYLLHGQRRTWFPDSYQRMRTLPRFYLLKINPRQRFPRIYSTRQVKQGVRYFGPFKNRAQMERMKTTLERTFRLRPCEFNIRGNRPYPDCLYFQMRTCSKPCNADIGRDEYLADVNDAIAFVQGLDDTIRLPMIENMKRLAEETRFEEATHLRKRLERVERARKDHREAYADLSRFDFVVLMRSDSARRRKLATVKGGLLTGFEEHEVADLGDTLGQSLRRSERSEQAGFSSERRYEDFCLVSHFIAEPVKAVHIVPLTDAKETVETIVGQIETEKEEAARARTEQASRKQAKQDDSKEPES